MNLKLILLAIFLMPMSQLAYSDEISQLIESAESGDSLSQRKLALAYDYGDGVPEDKDAAFMWLIKASENGDAVAQAVVGRLYYYGIKGMPEDPNQAFILFEKSATQGNAHGQYYLARAYFDGVGVSKNVERGMHWNEKLAKQGVAKAQLLMGRAYANGVSVPKNISEAYAWYFVAARNDGPTGDGYRKTAIRLRDKIEQTMTASELSEGQELADKYLKDYKPAADF